MQEIAPLSKALPPRDLGARARLRAATAGLHADVDGLFPDGLGSLADYHRYLLGMHRFAVDYEVATRALPRRSSWLVRDLVTHALLPLWAEGTQRPVAEASTRLGWDYVMAGSSLGARKLLRDVRRLGFAGGEGAHFLEQHAAGDDWPALQARLAAFDAGDARRMAQAESGARDAFLLVRACFRRSFEVLPPCARNEVAS